MEGIQNKKDGILSSGGAAKVQSKRCYSLTVVASKQFQSICSKIALWISLLSLVQAFDIVSPGGLRALPVVTFESVADHC